MSARHCEVDGCTRRARYGRQCAKHAKPPVPRWDPEPLRRLSPYTAERLAELVDVPVRYLYRSLSDDVADRCAIAIGLHPVEVWGSAWIDAGLTDADRAEVAFWLLARCLLGEGKEVAA